MSDISELNGKKIQVVKGTELGSEAIEFYCEDGTSYRMFHDQECCENVRLEDITGDVSDLLGKVVKAEVKIVEGAGDDSTTTFYDIQTIRGFVQLRWLGESNGCYSQDVYFAELKAGDTE